MRSRKIKKQIWLSDEEDYIMKCKSESVGMNASDYIRNLIMGYKPKEKPSENFYEDIKSIRQIGNNINQIARIANAKGIIDIPHLNKEIEKLDGLIIDIKNKYLKPEKID
ncbi:MAG: plasmid mobilization relaxosome protein MobC [Bacilli bacterium]|nr:plasmid mobilization relaxosome protein MobC [Bacilli bacterium]